MQLRLVTNCLHASCPCKIIVCVQVPVSMPGIILVHCFFTQKKVDMGLLSVVLLLGQHTISKLLSLDLISCAAYINIACTHSSSPLNQ